MVLETADIKRAIVDNPAKEVIRLATEENKRYRMHMYGENMKNYLPLIQGLEEKELRNLRLKYTRSNKDLFKRLLLPLDKVFSARGGSVYYNLSDAQSKAAANIAANIRGGLSIKKWVQSYWLPHFVDDPNGIIFMEVGDGYTYPTYKSVSTIHDWEVNGNKFEYLVFKLSTEQKKAEGIDSRWAVYRVIDDKFDRYVRMQNNIPVTVGKVYDNPFGEVPAIRNSNIIDPNNDGLMLSICDSVVELADEYLLKGSLKITHDFLHAFPKYWEFADDCETCKGTGKLDSKNCKECNGSGKSVIRNVSSAKLIKWPEDNDDFNPAPNFGGYIEPSETFYKISTAGLQTLEDAMHYTIWNRQPQKRTQGLESTNKEGPQTATEIIEDQAPLHERLHTISDIAEQVIKFVTDSMVEVEVKQGYMGSSINLGRRYLNENTDKIWERYTKAKNEGASPDLLDELYREFIESKYSTDPVSMDIMIKLMSVQPYRHSSIEQVKGFGVSEEVYKQKLYYVEWLNEQTDDVILRLTVEQLRESLKEYAGKMALAEPPKEEQNQDV